MKKIMKGKTDKTEEGEVHKHRLNKASGNFQ